MTLPLRKLGNRLRSCLTLMLLAIVELCAWRPLRADGSMRCSSDCAAPKARAQREPQIANNWQPSISAANAQNSHAPPQSTQAVPDSLPAHRPDGPNARIGTYGRPYRTALKRSRLAVQCRSPQAARLVKSRHVRNREWLVVMDFSLQPTALHRRDCRLGDLKSPSVPFSEPCRGASSRFVICERMYRQRTLLVARRLPVVVFLTLAMRVTRPYGDVNALYALAL